MRRSTAELLNARLQPITGICKRLVPTRLIPRAACLPVWRAAGDHHDSWEHTLEQLAAIKGKGTWSGSVRVISVLARARPSPALHTHARTHTHTHTRTHARTHARTWLLIHSLYFFVCPCRPHGWAYLDMMMIGARPGSYMRRPSLVIHTLPCHHWITSLQFLEGETESFLERQGGLTPTGTKKTKERAFLCTLCECSDDGAWRQHHVAATYLCRCFVQGSRLNAFCCCWPTRANREQNTAQDVGTAAPSS